MVHIFSPKPGSKRLRLLGLPTVVLAVALLHGCASVPPPDSQMNQAQSQLRTARDAGAADYAPVDLGFAQDKFQQASSAMASRKYDLAAQLADESRADAEVATMKARLGAARSQISSKSAENGRLRSELSQAQADAENQAQQSVAPPPSNVQETEMTLPSPAESTVPPAGDDSQGGQR
jgi:hypothetical protein